MKRVLHHLLAIFETENLKTLKSFCIFSKPPFSYQRSARPNSDFSDKDEDYLDTRGSGGQKLKNWILILHGGFSHSLCSTGSKTTKISSEDPLQVLPLQWSFLSPKYIGNGLNFGYYFIWAIIFKPMQTFQFHFHS